MLLNAVHRNWAGRTLSLLNFSCEEMFAFVFELRSFLYAVLDAVRNAVLYALYATLYVACEKWFLFKKFLVRSVRQHCLAAIAPRYRC